MRHILLAVLLSFFVCHFTGIAAGRAYHTTIVFGIPTRNAEEAVEMCPLRMKGDIAYNNLLYEPIQPCIAVPSFYIINTEKFTMSRGGRILISSRSFNFLTYSYSKYVGLFLAETGFAEITPASAATADGEVVATDPVVTVNPPTETDFAFLLASSRLYHMYLSISEMTVTTHLDDAWQVPAVENPGSWSDMLSAAFMEKQSVILVKVFERSNWELLLQRPVNVCLSPSMYTVALNSGGVHELSYDYLPSQLVVVVAQCEGLPVSFDLIVELENKNGLGSNAYFYLSSVSYCFIAAYGLLLVGFLFTSFLTVFVSEVEPNASSSSSTRAVGRSERPRANSNTALQAANNSITTPHKETRRGHSDYRGDAAVDREELDFLAFAQSNDFGDDEDMMDDEDVLDDEILDGTRRRRRRRDRLDRQPSNGSRSLFEGGRVLFKHLQQYLHSIFFAEKRMLVKMRQPLRYALGTAIGVKCVSLILMATYYSLLVVDGSKSSVMKVAPFALNAGMTGVVVSVEMLVAMGWGSVLDALHWLQYTIIGVLVVICVVVGYISFSTCTGNTFVVGEIALDASSQCALNSYLFFSVSIVIHVYAITSLYRLCRAIEGMTFTSRSFALYPPARGQAPAKRQMSVFNWFALEGTTPVSRLNRCEPRSSSSPSSRRSSEVQQDGSGGGNNNRSSRRHSARHRHSSSSPPREPSPNASVPPPSKPRKSSPRRTFSNDGIAEASQSSSITQDVKAYRVAYSQYWYAMNSVFSSMFFPFSVVIFWPMAFLVISLSSYTLEDLHLLLFFREMEQLYILAVIAMYLR